MSREKPPKKSLKEEDRILDNTLRPSSWEEYIGQEKIKKNIRIIIEAAKKRGEKSCEHILLYGSSGIGKTSLAYLIAKELGKKIKIIAGPSVEKPADLVSILTNLTPGDVLFIDEIHRLSKVVEEYLYPALEERRLNLILGKGPMAKTVELDLPPFTLIGATTRIALLSAPLRNRFGAIFQLNFYTIEEIKKILERSAKILNMRIEREALEEIAKRSRFTPRVANRLLKRVRDFSQVKGFDLVTKDVTEKALSLLEIDEMGLEPGDRKILSAIIEKFNGGPVGIQSLSAATSEEIDTILEIYEPYLLQIGFIERTPRGRIATSLAYKHFQKIKRQRELEI